MQVVCRATLVLIGMLLASCGGGGDSQPPAPSGLTYSAPPTLTVGTAMAALNPNVTGTVSSYSTSPALPAGLSLNSTSGVISGTPTAPAAAANYTITASNASGNTTATVSITVKDVAPTVGYARSSLVLTTDVAIAELVPTATGGAPTSWSVDPALPTGLALNAGNGHITGTPSQVIAAKDYVVTATNSGGESKTTLNIRVESGLLLDLGHARSIAYMRMTDTRLLTEDESGHWALWDRGQRNQIASGTSECFNNTCGNLSLVADLAGPTVLVKAGTEGLDARDAADGHLLAHFTNDPDWWRLADDGSYVVTGSHTGLSVSSRTGTALFTIAGNYSQAKVYAAAGELRVALGGAGANVIERIAVPSGTSTTTAAFSGEFHSWFVDGARFFTTVSNTTWIYASDSTQIELVALPDINGLTGLGDWYWTRLAGNVKVSKVGTNGTVAGTYTYGSSSSTSAVPSGATLAILALEQKKLRVVDLAGGSLSSTEYNLPVAAPSSYAIGPDGDWFVGTSRGVVLDGTSIATTPRYFGFGQALSISGSATRAVVATASGPILYFDMSTREEEGRINFRSSQAQLSRDGTVLAAIANTTNAQFDADNTVKLYSLPAGTETQSTPYTFGNYPYPLSFELSDSGTRIAHLLVTGPGPGVDAEYQVFAASGGGPLFTVAGTKQPLRFSPDGTQWTIPSSDANINATTNVYKNGVLTTAVPAYAVGWIDDHHFVANTYRGYDIPDGVAIYDDTGVKTASSPLTSLSSFQLLSNDVVYIPYSNIIVDVATGSTLWSTPTPWLTPTRGMNVGAVAGDYVVFASGSVVRAEHR